MSRVLFSAVVLTLGAGGPAVASMSDSDWGRLRPGIVVEAEGSFHPGQPLRAKSLVVRDGRPPGPEVELIGRLQRVDPSARTLTLLDLDLPVPASATIRREDRTELALGDLGVGDWLEVDGRVHADGAVTVERVKRYDADPGGEQIEGTVTAVDPGSRRLTIGSTEIRVSKSATIRGGVVIAVPRSIDDDYDARAAWTALNGRLSGGGRFQYEIEPETEFDLDPARLGNRTRGNLSVDMHFDAALAPGIESFVKVGYRGRRIIFDDEGDEVNVSDWDVQQAYALWRPVPLAAIQIGRQNFDEPREWLYDENLDAVRLRAVRGRWRYEASVSTRWWTPSVRLSDHTNWILLVAREMAREWLTEAYVIYRSNDVVADDRPAWIGVRSHGRLRSGRYHWLELAALRGTYLGEPAAAWAVDAGLRWRLVRRLGLEVTGGWAHGSGGPNAGDRFFQTGFHDNNAKFGGVTSFKYYGELLDPELSNLEIVTAAIGFRPTSRTSIDFVFHTYRQPHPEQRLFGANLESRPRGGDGDIGREGDLIVGFEEIPGVDLEYVYAEFRPGAAFGERATRARFHKLSVVFKL